MTAKIVSIDGSAIRPPGEASPNVVACLEDLLERAKSGDICGIAVVYLHSDDASSYQIAGRMARALIGCVEIMKLDMLEIERKP